MGMVDRKIAKSLFAHISLCNSLPSRVHHVTRRTLMFVYYGVRARRNIAFPRKIPARFIGVFLPTLPDHLAVHLRRNLQHALLPTRDWRSTTRNVSTRPSPTAGGWTAPTGGTRIHPR